MGQPRPNGHAASGRRLLISAVVLLLASTAMLAVACASGSGPNRTAAAPATASAPATTSRPPLPTNYRQLLPAGVINRPVVKPLCRRFRQTFAHWEATLRPRLVRLNAVSADDPRKAFEYVTAHHLSQTDNNGAFARRTSRLAEARLRQLAGHRGRYVRGDMVHDFKPNAIDACRLSRAYQRVSELASDVDLRVTAILDAAAQKL